MLQPVPAATAPLSDPLQWFPSGTAVSSPQPCSSNSQSGSATPRWLKAQVSTCNHSSLCSSFCTDRGWMCCPKGWKRFQRSCYFVSLDTMSWTESEQNCSGMGSQLVVINSRAEQVRAQG
uniref:Uncharacterized protein n=1 Tax=Malurus cyaneus samueli TaxID=2593467 RepID=A0A8C5TE83_9PASS